ncbi:MAG: FKBP-type peptidyl-prolyl cis-trans isomerase [Chloroflexota bacterium]|nr:FKBP-type peptidyl-prolyl cis-trans isomerase [Chloroflexota bacterium]
MKLLLAVTFAASLALAACGSDSAPKAASPPTGGVKPGASATAKQPTPPQATDGNAPGIPPLSGPIQTTPSGLRYIDEKVGDGASPASGQKVTAHYTVWLTNGTKVDSSRDRNQPYTFAIGQGAVIKGWDEGVLTMKVGGKRRLIIPSNLGYGAAGKPPVPPNAELIFDVELISVQ